MFRISFIFMAFIIGMVFPPMLLVAIALLVVVVKRTMDDHKRLKDQERYDAETQVYTDALKVFG